MLPIAIRPIMFGALLNCFMCGMLVLQVTSYFRRYKKDPLWIKCLVAFSTTIAFSAATLGIVTLYDRAITKRNVNNGGGVYTAMDAYMLMPSIQSATAQLFFAWRASRFINSRAFFAGAIISAMLQVGAGLAAIPVVIVHPEWRGSRTNPTCLTWNILACITDITIACILAHHLLKRRTGHPESDRLLVKVAKFTVQTGICTAAWAMLTLILFTTWQHEASLTLIMADPTLYANFLLAALNCRMNPGNDEPVRRSTGAPPIPDIPETPEKPQISEVTFMSLDVKSKSVATGRDTVDLESNFGMSEMDV